VTSTGRRGDAGTDTVISSSAVMAAGTLVSRILGFARASVLAWAIGTLAVGDAFSVANTVPNNLYILLAGGVLNAVLVPQIVRAAKDPDGGQEYLDRLVTLSATVLALVTVLVTVAAPLLIRLYADSYSGSMLALSVAFAFWCLPQVFCYGLYTLLGQVLNARGSFGPYMWAPAANNVVAIAGLLAFVALAGSGARAPSAWTPGMIALLAGSATLGVVTQALVLLPALRRIGFRWRPRWSWRGVGLRTAGRVAGWTFGAVLLGQLGFVVTSNVATKGGALARAAGQGDVTPGKAIYDFGFLLFMLPHSLVAVSLVTALFTRMARSAADGRTDDIRADLSLGLRITAVATVPATVLMLAVGPELTRVAFFGSPQATTDGIALVAMAMMLGVSAFSAQYLMQRVFYAFEDARTPFLVQIPVVLTWTAGNLLSLQQLPARYIVVGVGLSMSAANLLGAALSAVLLRRRLGTLDGRRVSGTYLRVTAAAALAGGVGWGVSNGMHGLLGPSRLAAVGVLAVSLLVLAGVYVLLLRLLRVGELDLLLRPLLARFRPRFRA
jgi:putative peptidoglycan lipid II flippase